MAQTGWLINADFNVCYYDVDLKISLCTELCNFPLSFLIYFGADADVQVLFSGLLLNSFYFFICDRFVSALSINTAGKFNAQSYCLLLNNTKGGKWPGK